MPVVAKTKTFEFPDSLRAAQTALDDARAAYRAYRSALPKWAEPMAERTLPDGTAVPAEPGWTQEQRAEEKRLLEAERQAAHAVWAHDFWAEVPTGDVVDARNALKHVGPATA
jgi:hypothetical protein